MNPEDSIRIVKDKVYYLSPQGSIKETTMKERIEVLTGWDKEADDILMEIGTSLNYFICIPAMATNDHCVYIKQGLTDGHTLVTFTYRSQCGKLQAFKDALLWLYEKSGGDKKSKRDAEIADLKARIARLENEE